jgi:hypothetical protein
MPSREQRLANPLSPKRCSRLSVRLYGMRGKGKRSGGKNVAFNDRSGCLIGSLLQALARGNQTLRVVRLLGSTGGAVQYLNVASSAINFTSRVSSSRPVMATIGASAVGFAGYSTFEWLGTNESSFADVAPNFVASGLALVLQYVFTKLRR